MNIRIVQKAKDKFFENIAKGKMSYVIAHNKYWVHWKLDEDDNYAIFSLKHYSTITCVLRIRLDKKKMKIFEIPADVISFDGWYSISDINSISQFLRCFNIDGRVNSREEYIVGDEIYTASNPTELKIDRTLQNITRRFIRDFCGHYSLKRNVRTDIIMKYMEAKVKEAKEREVVNAI